MRKYGAGESKEMKRRRKKQVKMEEGKKSEILSMGKRLRGGRKSHRIKTKLTMFHF